MFSVTVKAYAKLNIALNVLGVSNGFHMLDTVCTTVNKFDEVIAKKRNDGKILISFTGRYGFIPPLQEETNAYKATKAFINEFKTTGANIEIVRNIPTGSGMGGSSADIVGVLKALKKLYGVKKSIEPLATKLGSDTTYLLKGGFARLTGRGENVEPFKCPKKLYFVVIYSSNSVTAKDCFSKFDALNENGNVCDINSLKTLLENGEIETLSNSLINKNPNALTKSATLLNSEIQENLNSLESLSPYYFGMTGSGSTVFALYENLEMAKWAYSKLSRRYGNSVEILSSHDPKNLSLFDVIFSKDYYEEEF